MKITKSQLKRIIKEEVENALNEMEALGGISPEDVAGALIASGEEVTEKSVEDAVIEAGVLDDDIPDFADEVWVNIEALQNPQEMRL